MITKLWHVIGILSLSACAHATLEDTADRASAPFFFLHHEHPSEGEAYLHDEDNVFRPMQETPSPVASVLPGDQPAGFGADQQAALSEPAIPRGCSLRDRFDRDALVAYNFDDDQSRLSLHVDGGSGGSGLSLDKMALRFRFKFQPIKDAKEKCRYGNAAGFQGWAGSGYNELFKRRHNTVWDQLMDVNPLNLF